MTTHPGSFRHALPRRDFIGRVVMALAGLAVIGRPRRAEADTVPYLGEIMLFAGNFPPRGWALCNGQLLPINQNQALFSLLGTTYGGNGTTSFALPNLQGRLPIHFGQGPGLVSRTLGEVGGEYHHTLTTSAMPAHAHAARCSSGLGISPDPSTRVPARSPSQIPHYAAAANTTLAAGAISTVGSSQAHPNQQPTTALTYVIALQGVYPLP
jgi:microcystin-dependent protein